MSTKTLNLKLTGILATDSLIASVSGSTLPATSVLANGSTSVSVGGYGGSITGTATTGLASFTADSLMTAANGADVVFANTGDVTEFNIDFSDVQFGTKITAGVASSILGSVHDDTLIGSDGADTLIGDGGNDSLTGGKGDDSLVGGAGNDTLIGGAGDDVLTGSGGNDTFVWGLNEGSDTITDFSTAKGDTDTLYLDNANIADLKFSNTADAEVLTVGANTLTLDQGTGKGATSYTLKIKDQSGASKTVTFAATSVAASNTASDLYISNSSVGAIDYSATSVASVNLNDSTYSNFTQVTGSSLVASTLVGNYDKASSLAAATTAANSTDMWGGGSKADTMTGAADVADTFWFGSGDGKDSVNGSFGFADTDDVIKMYNVDDNAVKVVSGATTTELKLDNSNYLTLDSVATAAAGLKVKIEDSNASVTKAWLANTATGTTEILDTVNAADFYEGSATIDGLNFKNFTDAAQYWLGDTSKYDDIENVTGSATADDTLIGSLAGTLVGGSGDNVLWGGSNKAQTMTGSTGDNTFWFGAGDGKDVVTDYTTTGDNNTIHLYDQTYDKVLSGAVITAANNADVADNTDIKIAIGSDTLTLTNAQTSSASTELTITDKNDASVKAVVAANVAGAGLTYDADANLYVATQNNAQITFATGSTDDVSIFLGNGWNNVTNGSDKYFSANQVTGIDASNIKNADAVLVGYAAANNTFTGAGAGATTEMWGGGASNDTFIGGDGTDTFYFGTGDGNDTIKNATATDKVDFYNNAITDLTGTVTGGNLVISTTAGDKLTVNSWSSDAMNTFTVGTTDYSYDTKTKGFVKKTA